MNSFKRYENKLPYTTFLSLLGLLISSAYLLFMPPGIMGLATAFIGLLCVIGRVQREALGVYLLLWGPLLFGALFRCVGIEQLGPITAYPLAFLLLLSSKGKICLLHHHFKPAIIWLLLSVLTIAIAYLYGPMSSYSTAKLALFVFNLTIATIAFRYLTSSISVDMSSLGIFAVTAAALHYASIGYRIPHMMPTSILEPTGLRLSIVFREFTLPETNTLAYLACSAVLMVACGKVDEKRGTIEIFQAIMACILGTLIVLSVGQRTWIIALAFGAFALFLSKPKSKAFARSLVMSLSIMLVVGIILAITTGSRLIAPIYEGLRYNEKPVTVLIDRDKNWGSAIHRICEKPIIGHGLGGYYVDGYSQPGSGTYAHNLILELLSETGLIGTILIITPPIFFFIIPRRQFLLYFRSKAGGTLLPLLAMWFLCTMAIWDLKFSSHLIALVGVQWMQSLRMQKFYLLQRIHLYKMDPSF